MSEPIDRRQAIRRLSAPAFVPLLHGFHPLVPRQEGEWRPRFFQDSEVETVSQIAERIIPETDTPGARGALVHQYIDFALSRSEAPAPERFREGLKGLEQKCGELFGKPFANLEARQQDQVLMELQASPFFHQVKQLTVEGYYRSEVGMKKDLGFEGNSFLAEFEGCTHSEHREWSPQPERRASGASPVARAAGVGPRGTDGSWEP
jgi:hypothetical protein